MVLVFVVELESGRFINPACGNEDVIRPQHDGAISGLAGERNAFVHEAGPDAEAATVRLCTLSVIAHGNLDRAGGAMFARAAIDMLKVTGRGHWGRWKSRVRGLPEFASELPSAALAEEIDTIEEGWDEEHPAPPHLVTPETVRPDDEAHAVGVYGPRGSGWIEQTGCGSEVFLSVDTAGKALGVSGAFVSGPSWAMDYLIQRARPFMFSTAPPPALAAALDASLSVIEDEPDRRRRVRDLSAGLRATLAGRDINIGHSESQIIPIILGDNLRAKSAASDLQQEGFDVRAVRPPAVPPGTARLRVSVNAKLDEGILERFAASVQRVTSCSAVSS